MRLAWSCSLDESGADGVHDDLLRTSRAQGDDARSEFEARTDGVRDERLAKASTHSVLGPPTGAVGRDHDTGSKGAEVVEDTGDEGLENRSVEMESAHD